MNTVNEPVPVHSHLPPLAAETPDPAVIAATTQQIRQLLSQRAAVLIAHYYTDAAVQALAEETGGLVADSLEMARFGQRHDATTLVIAGVKFMGETAKILSPHKQVLMPTLAAECSLDLGCPAAAFSAFCDQHPERVVVVYANTSAAVKARADWVVTSSCAVAVIDHLAAQGQRIVWGPDKYLGQYIQQQTGADMVLWQGSCIVHEEFKAKGLRDLKAVYPDAAVLVHPEAPEAVIALADVVGSTSQLLRASTTLSHDTFIVATDRGIFYKMQQAAPDKQFLAAPTAGAGATCKSCGHCPWMAMNSLTALQRCLAQPTDLHTIEVVDNVQEQALVPLQRMLAFTAAQAA